MTLRCSAVARAGGEPLAGTAPHARAWVALEQPGPWGPQALTSSHLDAAVGAALVQRTAGLPVTVVLIRRPGRHADHRLPGPRTVLVAHSGPASSWLERGTIEDPAVLLDLDLVALADGARAGLGPLEAEPVLLVCTNSRRDTCCALHGRPAVDELAAARPGRVWESSHLGGHRFAPTVLSLPDGFVYGGPRAATLGLGACRGRSALPPPAQAAELAVLLALGSAPRPLTVEDAGPGRLVVHDAGHAWPVRVHTEALASRPESCGKPPVPGLTHRAVVDGGPSRATPRPERHAQDRQPGG
ncbi:MAG: sucrase ferredoxin [Actinomycetia bacterium]|jgi:hypothetical protein|nr:sucrase ferredoxin [Actinomycetes bacterium]